MDSDRIPTLLQNAKTEEGLKAAQRKAQEALPEYPKNGCAATLSAFLQLARIDVPMVTGAGKLAKLLEHERRWRRISVGEQMAGDVGVTYGENPPPGADHVYLVIEVLDPDKMLIADNQERKLHHRYASGKGKTRTEYFLRA